MINPSRHLSVFSPNDFGNTRIDVIGAGATGSKVVVQLAKLGIQNIHVWDFDKVEAHNIANQAFAIGHIGKPKVEALYDVVKASTGTKIDPHNERVDGSQQFGEVVFLLTDTMSSRKEIWEKGIRLKLGIKLMIETRMGTDNGRVYAINPRSLPHIHGWESTLTEDKKAVASACGASVTVGPTADVLSGMAVWQFIRWDRQSKGKDDLGDPENEVVFALSPFNMFSRNF